MTLKPIKTFASNAAQFVSKNSPTILTSCSVAGTISTAVLAAKAHTKANQVLFEERQRRIVTEEPGVELHPTVPFKERFKLTWKYYIPPVAMGAVTIACSIGANCINLKRNAVLAGAYALAETSLKEFKDAAQEIVGEEKVKEIKDKIIDDKINDNPPSQNQVTTITKGDILCYDPYSDRYFESSEEKIRHAVNIANTELFANMRLSMNDMYYALGLKPNKFSATRGWDLNDALDYRKDFPIEPRFTAHLSEKGIPCLSVEFFPEPDYL